MFTELYAVGRNGPSGWLDHGSYQHRRGAQHSDDPMCEQDVSEGPRLVSRSGAACTVVEASTTMGPYRGSVGRQGQPAVHRREVFADTGVTGQRFVISRSAVRVRSPAPMFTGKNAIRRSAERLFDTLTDTLTARSPFSGRDAGTPSLVCRDAILLTSSTQRRNVAVVVAEDQEPLAGAFGHRRPGLAVAVFYVHARSS